jgi:hypothetical protein
MNLRFVMAALAAGFAVAAPAPMMAATVSTVSNHSGNICKNYNDTEVALVDYLPYGVRSSKFGYMSLICPLVRSTQGSAGAIAYVDIKHTMVPATTTCTLYSYNSSGGLLGSQSLTWTGLGFHEFAFSGIGVWGVGRSNGWSDYSIICAIPGDYNGVIMGIDLSEY